VSAADEQRLTEARSKALDAFNALWMPGIPQRTQSRERALYWLSIARRRAGSRCDFETLDLAACKEITKLCTEAHGGRPI
jgi:hypothetical protein